MIVWQSKPGRLSGVFLPSLKRFAISVPAAVGPQAAHEHFVNGNQYSLALTTHTLYLGLRDAVWTMPIPPAPPKPRRSPEVIVTQHAAPHNGLSPDRLQRSTLAQIPEALYR